MKKISLRPRKAKSETMRLMDRVARVVDQARNDPESAFGFLFKDLPMAHRVRFVEDGNMYWLKVSFVDSHKKAWGTEKYFLPDVLMHPDDYMKDVANLCWHSMALKGK